MLGLLVLLARWTGLVAVVAGLLALSVRKGGGLHVTAGRVVHALALALAAVLVLPLVYLGDAATTLLLAVAAYLVHAGRRAVQRPADAPPTPVDLRAAQALGALGVLLFVIGVALTVQHGPIGWTAFGTGMGLLLLATSAAEVRRLRAPPDEPHAALAFHAGAMGGAVVALATAWAMTFAAAHGGPAFLAWVGPGLIGIPVLARWVGQIRREGRNATFL
ncbi:MAG: hypothetical protein H6732_16155 [Alphaproteobacteria bacterium]|nr:hypothetical protein [Alphaproteobacteria bacterium]